MEIKISFPENQQVRAELDGFSILTDQPKKYGGDDKAPSPYSLFLASLATCGGYYLLKFCEARKIDHKKINMKMIYEWKDKESGSPFFEIKIELPPDFDEKYIEPLKKSVEQCAVKKAIQSSPVFKVSAEKVASP
ncbi:MAG: OsmC family protein [Acidobacteriota bacterium]|nr:osmotically inducible protein OsmC [Thermoanaerobaculaceae bacterium]